MAHDPEILGQYRKTRNYVWDVDALEWVPEQQPILDGGTVIIGASGLATEAKQDVGNASLSSIDTKLSSQATAAKQDTGNTSLSSIDTKLTSQATAANQTSGAQKTQIVDLGGDAATVTNSRLDVNVGGLLAVIDSNNSSSATLAGNATFTGTGTDVLGYASISILVYSDKDSATLGVKLEFSPDNTNWVDASQYTFTSGVAAPNAGQTFQVGVRNRYFRVVYVNGASAQTTFILQTVLQPASTTSDIADLSVAPVDGQHALTARTIIYGKTTAGGGSFVSVKVNPSGSLATSDDIASFGGTTVTLGQKAMTASMPVVLASDQTAVSTKEIKAATTSVTSVNDTASSTTLLASNANRLGATIFNDSTVTLYLKLGATASTTSFAVAMVAASYYEVPFGYTGVIDGIWASDASGAARITEITA